MTARPLALTDFLLERIAEDEAVAREAKAEDARIAGIIGYEHEGPDRSFWADLDGARPSVSVGPARVLAEVAAKRNLIQAHRQDGDAPWCMEGCGMRAGGPEWPCDTLYWMAGVYADHPDYQADWA